MSLSALSSGGEGRSLAPLSRSRLVVYFLILVAWIAYAPKIVPYRGSDRGIFVSVAERLLAGDILNKDVLDNKDPYFITLSLSSEFAGCGAQRKGCSHRPTSKRCCQTRS